MDELIRFYNEQHEDAYETFRTHCKEPFYAFGVFHGRFYEFGKCRYLDSPYYDLAYRAFVIPYDISQEETEWKNCLPWQIPCRHWEVSPIIGKVYKHRNVCIKENDPIEAIRLISDDLKLDMIDMILKIIDSYNRRINVLKEYEDGLNL